ncbi:MAG: 50S ribosomal protein L6 [Candidatus Neomarinimicrobiota bacterium]
MSRVGEKPIQVPDGVTVSVDGRLVSVMGPRGTLQTGFGGDMVIKQSGGELAVERQSDSKSQRSLHGTVRAILSNMVEGVTTGFSKELQVLGVGYTANMEGKGLRLAVGYSHDIYLVPPNAVEIKASRNSITVSGIDKQLVGQVAAKIRSFRPPEPYKGKGIRYSDEYVRIKKGKTIGGEEAD